jgi:hypothetical protein
MDRLVVEWATADPDRLVGRLTTLGFALTGPDRLVFPAGEVRLVRVEPAHGPDRLQEPRWEPTLPGSDLEAGHPNAVRDIAALGWATVDADRMSAAVVAGAARSFQAMPDDEHLGARVRGSLGWRPGTLVLEPVTEGRLAATLARGGEGPAALYLVAGHGGLEDASAGAVKPGPLGPALLLPGGVIWGPHLLVVAPVDRTPGTINP